MTGYLRVPVPLLLSNLLTNKVFNKPWDQFLCEMVRFRVLHGGSIIDGGQAGQGGQWFLTLEWQFFPTSVASMNSYFKFHFFLRICILFWQKFHFFFNFRIHQPVPLGPPVVGQDWRTLRDFCGTGVSGGQEFFFNSVKSFRKLITGILYFKKEISKMAI